MTDPYQTSRQEMPLPSGRSLDLGLKIAAWSASISVACHRLGTTLADYDLWGSLSFGQLFWTRGLFPYEDVFSYTPTLHPWVNHSWLAGVLFFPLYQYLGPAGLQLLKYGLALMTLVLIYATAKRRGAYPLAAGVMLTVLAIRLTPFYMPLRAHVFTFFFFALFLLFLEQARQGGNFKRLYALPLLMVLWCNLHGGFLAGLGLIFLYALGELLARRTWRPYAVVLAAASLVTLLNPYGLEYWEYLLRTTTRSYPHIIEWASLLWSIRMGYVPRLAILTLALLLFVALFAWWQSRRWQEITPSLALAVTLVLGFRQQRHLIFFLLLLAAYLPVCLNIYLDYLRTHKGFLKLRDRKGNRLALLATLSFLTFFFFFTCIRQKPLSLVLPAATSPRPVRNYPIGGVNFIKEQGLGGNLVVSMHWGEYLIWELYPRCRVAFDGRYDTVYPPEVVESYFAFHYALPGWRQFLERYPPDLVLLDGESQMVPLLKREPGWRVVYVDEGCVLFQGRQPKGDSP